MPIGEVTVGARIVRPGRSVELVEAQLEAAGRTAMLARAWRLRVVTMHLDTSMAMWRGGPAQARSRQARSLLSALPDMAEPTVLAGDLNTWWGDDEPAVKEFRRAFPDAIPDSNRQVTWRGPLGTGTRVDYLFARTGGVPLRVRRLDRRFGSDHYPLMTIVPVE